MNPVQQEKKRINQRAHTLDRAEERYGLQLEERDLRDMAKAIKKGDAKFIRKATNRITKWLVFCVKSGRWLPVAYDKRSQEITSVLPWDEPESQRAMRYYGVNFL